MSDDQLIAPGTLDAWEEVARGDDWHRRLVGSDIRLLIGDLKRARHRLASTQPAPAFPREEEMIEALRPFAEAADDLDEKHHDSTDIWEAPAAMSIKAGHLRRAAALLQGKQP